MGTKHTPGPWEWGTSPEATSFAGDALQSKNGTVVLDYTHWSSGMAFNTDLDHGEVLANAHLIAASPLLLKELQHLVRLLTPLEIAGTLNVPGLATLNGARAAIAQALPPEAP